MGTGTPFVPALLSTTVVRSAVATAFRPISYIPLSEFQFAPVSLSSQRLVNNSTQQTKDSPASLAKVIRRASDWADFICFHKAEGFFAAYNRVESDRVTLKPDGSFDLICNVPPVRELTGLAVGPAPSQQLNMTSTAILDTWIEDKVIHIPAAWSTTPTPALTYTTDLKNRIYATWSYVSGWPIYQLASEAKPTDNPPVLNLTPFPGQTSLAGIYPGSVLTIHDVALTEDVVVQSVSGTTVTLAAAVTQDHKPPTAPDWTRVSALPTGIDEAVILLTSVLLKIRGTRANVMPTGPGGFPTKKAMGLAGVLDDFDNACKLLHPFQTVYLHG